MKNEFFTISLIAVMLVVGWSMYDNADALRSFLARDAQAVESTATLNATVSSSVTLNLTDGATVAFGTISAGTESHQNTTFQTDSNDTVDVSLGRDRSSPATTLASNADASNINISDTAGGLDVFDGVGTCSATQPWVDGSSTGLGFSIYAADENKDTSCWGTGTTVSDTNNEYAALQASSSASTAWSSTTTGTKNVSVSWTLDVTGSQQATDYTGDVIVTATTSP